VQRLKALTDARGISLVTVAVAWVLAQPGITSAIIGASKPSQLKANVEAVSFEFDDELMAACEAAWWQLPRRPVAEGYR